MKLLVIGAGAAGTAAAWRASRQAEVTVAHARAGATALYCGAIDDRNWGELDRPQQLDANVTAFITALGCWSFGSTRSLFATHTGRIRAAWGGDSALLNLAPLAGRRIAVADLGRATYLATETAWALRQTRWAQESQTTFVPIAEPLNEPVAGINDYDFAALHDEPRALHALAERLARSGAQVDAWLLPPSLGAHSHARHVLEERLGAPVGEQMGLPGGPSGARFEVCRDDLFAARGIRVKAARIIAIETAAGAFRPRYADEAEVGEAFDRVVLATGGIVAGGIRLGEARREASSGFGFELSLDLPVMLRLGEQEIDRVSSLHGFDPTAAGSGALEQIGIAAEAGCIAELPGLFPAGDAVADRPRTVLEAVRSGCRAADLALVGKQAPSRL